jgi:hypothetical protein
VFFSVHEELFHGIEAQLVRHGVTAHSGFVWGEHQRRYVDDGQVTYDPLVVFTRDILPAAEHGQPDLAWLEQRERELGVSIQRMLAAERHLWKGRTYEQILRLAEVILREVAAALDRSKPDFIWSEDVSCFTSFAHYVLAKERGIPFWCIGTARLPGRISVYSKGFQRSEYLFARFDELRASGLTAQQREASQRYVDEFRDRPARPPGMDRRAERPGLSATDGRRLLHAVRRYIADPADPTVTAPHAVVRQRLRRMARIRVAELTRRFEDVDSSEKYVVYPIHFQPEASTLVQAPMYLDQLSLIQDIARSLPIGYRLYVKEHLSNRGRRPIAFYDAIAAIPSVRLLGPDVDTWSLIRGASAISVITGTMGWEGLLFGKPVITFGSVWFNALPHVYRGDRTPRDDLHALYARALFEHRPDHEALLALIVAMRQISYPGRIHNPRSFPLVLEPENVEHLARALADNAIDSGASMKR